MEVDIKYEYDNMIYTISGNPQLHQQLQADSNFFKEYINGTHSAAVEMQVPNFCFQDEDSMSWTSKNIILLLEEIENVKMDLRNPKTKKKEIWRKIKENMFRKGVQNLTEDTIERKFRNMKATFKKITDNIKKSSTGRRGIKWEYYDSMEKIFEEDETIMEPEILDDTHHIVDDDSTFWTRKKILLLLDEIEKAKMDFENPKIKKREIWRKVKENMFRKGVQNITEDMVERKFRNMKATYKNIKANKKPSAEIKWEYYDSMERIFQEDNTMSTGHTASSLNNHPLPLEVCLAGSPEPDNNISALLTTCASSFGVAESDKQTRCFSGIARLKNTPAYRKKRQHAERGKELYGMRKRQLDMDQQRLQELVSLRQAIEENNKIQAQRNILLKEFLEMQK